LATNAVLHARTGYRVTLQAPYSGLLRIEVSDENPRPPAPAPDEPGATSGRGLHVVAGLAATWGSESSALGKVVWAELGDRQVTDPECYDLRDVDSTEDALAQIDRRRSDSSAR